MQYNIKKSHGRKFTLISTKFFDDGKCKRKILNYNVDSIWMIGKAITADYFLHLYRKYKMSVTIINIYHSSRLEIKGRTTKTLQEIQ